MPSRLRTLAALAPILSLTLSACASGPPPAPPVPQIAGSYTGSITFDGNAISGSLTVAQEGPALDLTFSFPELAVTARGDGQLEGETLRARVSYTLACPGAATFDGRVEDGETRLVGTFRAEDCENLLNGTFRFTRRD